MDLFNLPQRDSPARHNQWFYYNGNDKWQMWKKPKGFGAFFISICGGGGGGGGGMLQGAGNGRSGGSGGCGAATCNAFFPEWILPDTLYILVGQGGAGGAANTNGANGNISFVCVTPNSDPRFVFMASGANGTIGGPCGANTTPTAVGRPQYANSNNAMLCTNGIVFGINGSLSSIGGVPTGGTGASLSINQPTMLPGTGGGGLGPATTVAQGGSFSGFSGIWQVNMTTNTNANTNGEMHKSKRFSLQAALGGIANSTIGAGSTLRGGDGTFGCGGGGGGATPDSNTGAGGKGGDGLVVIIGM